MRQRRIKLSCRAIARPQRPASGRAEPGGDERHGRTWPTPPMLVSRLGSLIRGGPRAPSPDRLRRIATQGV
eukprot:9487973-Pyramimonas_sp.AAC.2